MKRTLFAALLAGVFSLSTASGAIVVFPDQNIPIPTTFIGVYVDLETGTDMTGPFVGADVNFIFGGAGLTNDAEPTVSTPTWQPVRSGTGNLDPVEDLAFGVTVDAGSTFSTGYGASGFPFPHIPPFVNGVPGYLGFSLEIGGNTHYGWMNVILNNDGTPGTILSWAYEDVPDTGIQVGIPEPSGPLLGALALVGLALRRRRS